MSKMKIGKLNMLTREKTIIGEEEVIYITLDDGKVFRLSEKYGTLYVMVDRNIAVYPETSNTLRLDVADYDKLIGAGWW